MGNKQDQSGTDDTCGRSVRAVLPDAALVITCDRPAGHVPPNQCLAAVKAATELVAQRGGEIQLGPDVYELTGPLLVPAPGHKAAVILAGPQEGSDVPAWVRPPGGAVSGYPADMKWSYQAV